MTRDHKAEAAPVPVSRIVRECIAEVLGVPPESVTSGTRLGEDLGADSLDLAEILARVETRSGVVVEQSRLTSIATVGDACAALTADGTATETANTETEK